MRQNMLINNENVEACRNMFDYLETRPISEMVGLGLIYGPPGFGKSRTARKLAIERGWLYVRMEHTMTAKAFLWRLCELLQERHAITAKKSMTANDLHRIVVNTMAAYNEHAVLDEIDSAFGNKDLLGTIREIVDEAKNIIVLVGMANAKHRLSLLDAHYFDRCNGFVEFVMPPKEEVIKYIRTVCDIKLTPQQCDEIYYEPIRDDDGAVVGHTDKPLSNIRQIVKRIREVEALELIKAEGVA